MRILLVKLSSLGDVVHTLPVVQDILTILPDAQIDWVTEKAFAPLLIQVNGLHRIIPCELRRWRKSFWSAQTRHEWRAFKTDLRRDKYDAVIDLQGLTKSAIVARLTRLTTQGKRYAMANQTEGSGYEAPTRWVADVPIAMALHVHAVQRGRDLIAASLGFNAQLPGMTLKYGLNNLSKEPLGQSIYARKAPDNRAKKIAFIHGTSRQDKAWSLQSWVDLGQRLMAVGHQIVLMHGSGKELATSQTIAAQLGSDPVVLPLLPLDELTHELKACQGAIGVDSGVSHIAVALGLPHVQIYNFDTAWRTGPLGCHYQTSVFSRPSPTVEMVWKAWQSCKSDLS